MTPESLDAHIVQASNVYALPYALLKAQVMQESSGDPFAFRYEPAFFDRYIRTNESAKGYDFGPLAACSYGLMQIMLETALEIGFDQRPERLFDPQIGLAWGCKHMRALWDWAGGQDADYYQALCAYNGGKGGNKTKPFRNAAYADAVYARVSP